MKFLILSIYFVIGGIILNSPLALANSESCAFVFTQPENSEQQYISYLSLLLKENIISITDLEKLKKSLDEDHYINPVPHSQDKFGIFFSKAVYQIHYEAIESIINTGSLNKHKIIVWLKTKLEKTKDTNIKKEKTKSTTQIAFQKMEFHRVEPGSYMMGPQGKKVQVTISKPFEMMSTLVTQMMWLKIKSLTGVQDKETLNPSSFKSGPESKVLNINNVEVSLKPDHPVEFVSWYDAKEFIIELNELSKSNDIEIQNALIDVIEGHKKGDHYDLPTEAQWEFVMKNRGNNDLEHFDRNDSSELSNYAWYNNTIRKVQTQAVASLLPRIVDGKSFYDLEGNVGEWVQDWNGRLLGGKDPKGATTDENKVVKNGSWITASNSLTTSSRTPLYPHLKDATIGFRLVRNLESSQLRGDSK